MNKEYNGFKNYETWNVNLWLFNDEGLYSLVQYFMRRYKGRSPYSDFVTEFMKPGDKTPDGISYSDPALCRKELNESFREENR